MRLHAKIFLCVFLFSGAITGTAKNAAAAPSSEATQAVNAFAIDLYGRLSQKEGNIFFSPYPLFAKMAMLYAGAEGETRREIGRVFRFETLDEALLHASMRDLRTALLTSSGKRNWGTFPDRLEFADAVWVDKDLKLSPRYIGLVNTFYDGGLVSADFRHNPRQAVEKINDWTREHTSDQVKKVLEQNDLSQYTRLIVTDAFLFESEWKHIFEKGKTRNKLFHVSKNETIRVEMMTKKEECLYGEFEDIQVVGLPLRRNDLSFYIFLPASDDKFKQTERLEKRIAAGGAKLVSHWLGNLDKRAVNIQMPAFRDQCDLDLKPVFKDMGVVQAFDSENADFGGIVENASRDRLAIGNVRQASSIQVWEKGVKAVSLTLYEGALASGYPRPEVFFTADRPFLYAVVDNAGGLILFWGRMVRPQKVSMVKGCLETTSSLLLNLWDIFLIDPIAALLYSAPVLLIAYGIVAPILRVVRVRRSASADRKKNGERS